MDNNYIDNMKENAKNLRELNKAAGYGSDDVYAMLLALEETEENDIRNDIYDARVLRQLHADERQRLLLHLQNAKENALKYYQAIDHIVEELTLEIIKQNQQELEKREAERSK